MCDEEKQILRDVVKSLQKKGLTKNQIVKYIHVDIVNEAFTE